MSAGPAASVMELNVLREEAARRRATIRGRDKYVPWRAVLKFNISYRWTLITPRHGLYQLQCMFHTNILLAPILRLSPLLNENRAGKSHAVALDEFSNCRVPPHEEAAGRAPSSIDDILSSDDLRSAAKGKSRA